MASAGTAPREERIPAVEITWLGQRAESVPEPGHVPMLGPEASPEPELSVPDGAEKASPPTGSETIPEPDFNVHPEPVMAGVHVVVDAAPSWESNYWLQVRAELMRHLRWPAGAARSTLVMVDMTVDEAGGLVEVSMQPEPGTEAYARVAERAVRRAAPFPPPGPAPRTARLPVRFSNHKPTEK